MLEKSKARIKDRVLQVLERIAILNRMSQETSLRGNTGVKEVSKGSIGSEGAWKTLLISL